MSNKFDLIKKPLKRPQKKFHKLKNLKCFNEVDRRVKNGYPLSDIARYIQEERGEYKEAKSTSVVGLLNEYRNSLSAADVVSNNMPSTFLESEKKLKKTLNELEELEKLYFEQKELTDDMIKVQKETGIVMPSKSLTYQVELLVKILDKSASLKMDLGMTQRNLGRMTLESNILSKFEHKYGKRVADVFKNVESRKKILNLVDRFKKVGESK